MIIHRDKRKYTKTTILVLVSLVIMYALFFSPAKSLFSGAIHTTAVPVWKAGDSIATTFKPFAFFSSRREVYLENKDLVVQVEVLNAKLADRHLLREENIRLKSLLGRDDVQDRVLSVVLSKPSHTPYDTLVIDVGENQGVSKGDKVMLGSVLLGEVLDVYYVSSKVILYSTSEIVTDVIIGDAAIPAQAVGQGGGVFNIVLPRESEVYVGDTVYTPGIEPYIIGVVEKIDKDANDAFITIHVVSQVNPFTVSHVEVIL